MKVLCFLLSVHLFSCLNKENKTTAEIDGVEYRHLNSGELMDSFKERILHNTSLKNYEFTVINIARNDTIHYLFIDFDKNYKLESKSFEIDRRQETIIRIDNEKIALADGKTYYYILESGRPIVIKDRDWAMYTQYITNDSDYDLIEKLIKDSTCFFICPNIESPKPNLKEGI